MSEATLPYNTRGYKAFGQKIAPMSLQYAGAPTTGVFASAARSTVYSFMKSMREWEATWDLMGYEGPSVSPEFWKEKVGDRDIPYVGNVSADELDRLVKQYDNEEYISRFQPDSAMARAASFMGNMVGASFSPVAVATAFMGGWYFKQATLADNALDTLKFAVKGGALQGAGATGADVLMHAATGQKMTTQDILANALAPVVLGVPLSFGARAVTRLFDPEGARAFAKSEASKMQDDPQDVAQKLIGMDAPPKALLEPPPPDVAPARWIKEVDKQFPEYDGGARQWLRELAAGVPSARAKADEMRVDVDDPTIQSLLRRWGQQTDSSSMTPVDYNVQMLQDMRSLSPEGRSRLRQNGVLTTNDDVREPYADLFTAATTDPADRTPEQVGVVQDFIERGAGPTRARARKDIEAEIKPLRKQLRDLRDLTRGNKKTKRLTQMRQEAARVANKIFALEIRRDNYAGTGTARVLDDSVRDEEIVEAITTLARTRRVQEPEPQPMPSEVERAAATALEDAGVDDPELARWVQAHMAEDTEELDSMLQSVNEAMKVCRSE